VRKFNLLAGLALAGMVLAAWLIVLIVKPGPAGRIVLATGGADGMYNDLALGYKSELERFGVRLELRPGIEGVETLNSLFPKYWNEYTFFNHDNTDVQGGFLRGGFATSLQGRFASSREHAWRERIVSSVRSVGRLFYEPIWVFYRGPETIKSLKEMRKKRLYVGAPVSGARRVALHLLKANAVDENNATIIDEDLPDDAAPLLSGAADVAFLMAPPDSPRIQRLLRNPKIRLMSFGEEADVYTTRFPSLTKVMLRKGALDFEPESPSADIALLATSVALVVQKDMDPALVSLLTYAVTHNPKSGFDRDGDPVLFYEAGKFPSAADPEFETALAARQVYQSGDLSALLRGTARVLHMLGLPFWPAAFVNNHGLQTLLIAIPTLTILWPMLKIFPMAYDWFVRRRILYWYRRLTALERSLDERPTAGQLEEKRAELGRIEQAVIRMQVPLTYSVQFYDLRAHVDLVSKRLSP
jgi:uncharacterized protein